MRFLWTMASAILSGLLLGAAMPPVGVGWLGWFALVPLLAAVQGERRAVAALAGFLAAAVASLALDTGLLPVPHQMEGEANWIFTGYCLFGILLAVVCYEVSGFKQLRFRQLPYLAALAVCLEAAMVVILPVHLALSQYRLPAAMWLASLAGIWGVSYGLWFTALLLAKLVRSRRGACWPYLAWIGVVALGIAFLNPPVESPGGPLKIGLIQSQSIDTDELTALNKRAGALGADLVVWPELSAMVFAPSGDSKELKELSLKPGQPPFVAGFEDDHVPKPHNVAALYVKGAESERYFKRKPFGAEQMMHEAGTRPVVAAWRVPVGLNICFDSCYPWVMRDTVLKGAQFIALPTEDPPSKNGIVQALHSAYMPFRSAELGVPIYRADITAYSTVTGPDGRVLADLSPGENVIAVALPGTRDTFYRRFGDWFLYLCIALAVGTFAGEFISRRQRKKSNGEANTTGDS